MDDIIKEWLDVSWWVTGGTMVKLAKVVACVSVGGDWCSFYHQRIISVGSAALVVEWGSEVAEKFEEGTLVRVSDVFRDVVVKEKFLFCQLPLG